MLYRITETKVHQTDFTAVIYIIANNAAMPMKREKLYDGKGACNKPQMDVTWVILLIVGSETEQSAKF